MECLWHLCDNILTGRQRKFCSISCKSKYNVDLLRRNLKGKAVSYKGGKCQRCGYDRCAKALEFHHLDPNQKDFGISQSGHTRSWSAIKAELDKCIMVCSNCHKEIHDEEEQTKRKLPS